ncbi:MAG: hypothetical protein JSU65_01735, partial [Candidatus Zixiibacteriota bacterium]
MALQTIDWFFAFLLLAALFLIIRFRRHLRTGGTTSYNQIITGIAILAVTQMARVYYNAGLWRDVAFISEPLFYQLITWIAVITGCTLLLSGISVWLPIAREHRKHSRQKVLRLEFLKKVEQLVSLDTRLDPILSTTLEYMREHYGFRAGAVMKYSRRQRRLSHVSTTGNLNLRPANMFQLSFSEDGWQKYLDGTPAQSAGIIRGLQTLGGHPGVILPIAIENAPACFFVLWKGLDTELTHEDELNLKTAVDVIARKIESDRLRIQAQVLQHKERWQQKARECVKSVSDLREGLNAIVGHVRQLLRFDLISLVAADSQTDRVLRMSAGWDGALLIEQNVERPRENTITGSLLKETGVVSVLDINGRNDTQLDHFLATYRPKTVSAHSKCGPRVSIALVIASGKPQAWSQDQVKTVGGISAALTPLIQIEENRLVRLDYQRRLDRIRGFLNVVNASFDFKASCQYASRMLADELEADLVRISELDASGRFLESRALEMSRPIVGMVPDDGAMILSVMPQHDTVRKTGRTVVVGRDRSSPSLAGVEGRQMFGSAIQSA